MKIGVLGTGMVGEALASKFVSLGHEVKMGAREAGNPKAQAWAKKAGGKASHGSFVDAARFGEMVFTCTRGDIALDAIRMAGPENFAGKTVVDVANPLDFSHGMPPSLIPSLSNTTSLAEQVQKLLPKAHVVKAFNTMNVGVMVAPEALKDAGVLFLCGNDAGAKKQVTDLARSMGWRDFVDLGDITGARGTEALLLIWMRLWQVQGTPMFNFKLVR